jgi:hypothetical protein
MHMTIDTISTIASEAINISKHSNAKTGKALTRNGVFKQAFERFEMLHGKSNLTSGVKESIRNEVDAQLRSLSMVDWSEVVNREQTYERVGSDGYETGRKVDYKSIAPVSLEQQIIGVGRVLAEHRRKVATRKEGATESDIRKERRIRNELAGLLANAKLDETVIVSEGYKHAESYFSKLEALRTV